MDHCISNRVPTFYLDSFAAFVLVLDVSYSRGFKIWLSVVIMLFLLIKIMKI